MEVCMARFFCIGHCLIFFLLFFPRLALSGPVFLEKPQEFHPVMDVAGCFCVYEGKVLLLLRNSNKPQGHTWCAPGGKLEYGESPDEAVIREVMEETGVNLKERSLTYCRTVFVRFPSSDFNLHLFKVDLEEEPQLALSLQEHQDYRWVTLEEALNLPLIPGGDDCLKIVFNEKDRRPTPYGWGFYPF